MLLLGGQIQGGQVIGQSSEVNMLSQPVDLVTGSLSSSGDLIGNNHIARTLLHSIGVEGDLGDYRVDPILALLEN